MIDIPHIAQPISYSEFYRDYLLSNRPCILDEWITNGWDSRRAWSSAQPGGIDIQLLLSNAPSKELCVADCSRLEFDAHPVVDMSAEEYLTYWDRFHRDEIVEPRSLYLKDWHYFRRPENQSYYVVPKLFSSDWMNEFWKIRPDSEDDFRFVYLGTQGTWTPLHADVYRSFSWSANILGQKRWWFFPPGEEKKLQACNNNKLPVDVRDLDLEQLGIKYAVFNQSPGQAVFVPSGWYHEVLNVTDCVSINHNWFNATNVAWVWQHIQEQLELVEQSTDDVRDTPGWHEQCQVCLRALTGINFHEFFVLLKYILITRWPGAERVPPEFLSIPQNSGDTTQDAAKANALSAFEQCLDSIFCRQFDKDPTILDRATDCPLEQVFTNQINTINPAELESDQWLHQLDFSSAASVLHAFCAHSTVRELQLISGCVEQRLTAIKWITD